MKTRLKPNLSLSPQARRERNRAEMKEAILAAAREIMRAEGAAALNLHEIARRVRVQTPSLYAYFESKAAIYDALFRLGVQMYTARLEEIEDRHGPTWDGVAAAFRAMMQFGYENPELYQMVFERPVPRFVPSDDAMAESRQMLARAQAMITRAIELGNIQTDLPPDKALNLVIAMMQGLVSQHLANEPHLPPGKGRFGSLLVEAVALFQAAWGPRRSKARARKSAQ